MQRRRTMMRQAARAGPSCACFNLRRAARAVTQLYDDMLRGSGLRSTQLTLLMLLAAREELSMSDLADLAVLDRTTLSRNLRILERRGLVQVRPAEDRRVRKVSSTPRGSQALARAFPLWERAQAEMASGMGQARLARLLVDLRAAIAAAGRGAPIS